MNYKLFLKKNIHIIKYAVCALFIVIAGVIYVSSRRNTEDNQDTFAAGDTAADISDTYQYAESQTDDIYVYVCGNVRESGVVKCSSSMRIYEAVELAGGITEDADVSSINMAAVLKDGERIYIPAYGEQITVQQTEDNGLVNINEADESQLTKLPGIGSARAAQIIEYRNDNGRFESIEDIMNVSGIKESAYNKIKEHICV